MRTKLVLAAMSFLSCVTFACASQQSGDEPKEPPSKFTEAEKAKLAADFHKLMKEQCAECHDYGAKKVYDNIDYLLDYDKLVKSKIVDLNYPKQSALYDEIAEGSMPRKFDENGKPRVRVKLPKEQAELVLNWLKAGAPRWQ